MKKPMDLADQLVREHANRIADTVTRVRAVWPCVEFTLKHDLLTADVVRLRDGTYRVIGVVMQYDGQAWSMPETDLQRSINKQTEDYCYAHDAEIRLAIDAALTPDPIAAHGDGTNEDSLDADWKDGGA